MREIELKLAINPTSAVGRLLEVLPAPSAAVEQHNLYFVDPEGVLARARIMLRLRGEFVPGKRVPERVILTAKRRPRAATAEGVFVADEIESDLPAERWEALAAGALNLLALTTHPSEWICRELDIDADHPVVCVGRTINLRRRIRYEGFDLELDETTFPNGRIDAEIEVETEAPDRARRILMELGARAGVRLTAQKRGKYARFRQIINDVSG